LSGRYVFSFKFGIFLSDGDTDRFRVRHDVAFSAFTDEGLAGVVGNDVIFELNPFWSGDGVFIEHVVNHIGEFL
jgi:hypothetical protein